MPGRDEDRTAADPRGDADRDASVTPEPADTTHPVGEEQAAENSENDPPG